MLSKALQISFKGKSHNEDTLLAAVPTFVTKTDKPLNERLAIN